MCIRLQPHVSRYSGESAAELGPKLLEELQLVRNAFFCSPEDQSAWFYHRWLLAQLAQHSSAAVAPQAVLLDELGAVEELLARPRGQSRRPEQGLAACGSRRPRPLVRRPSSVEFGPRGPCGAALGPLRVAAQDADFCCASPLRSSSLSASGRCSRRRGRLTVPPWWRRGLLSRPPGRHGFRSGLPCALPRHASAVQTAAAAPYVLQSACAPNLLILHRSQAALLTTALGRGEEATARFEACRRVDPFRAAYYDHQMARA